VLVFDIESNGLLDALTTIHCINVLDRITGKRYSFNAGVYADGSSAPRDGTIEEGLAMLEEAEEIAGHNIIAFDIPALQKVYPKFAPRGVVFDTLVCVNVIYTNIKDRDYANLKSGRLDATFVKSGLIGRQSLEAWGYRLGVMKGSYDGPWEHYTPAMDEYARQDPEVTLALVEHVEKINYAPECIELEHDVMRIIKRQERRGFAFNVTKAEALTAKLQKRMAELSAECATVFKPWTQQLPDFIPKRDNKKMGYKAGVPVKKSKVVVFNPGSRQHIASRLTALYDWIPTKFTDNGQPAIDETVLGELPWPEAKVLAEYLMVEKRLGQLSDGKKACLKMVRNGRIHGSVRTNGAVTGRMTHSDPNVAQTPKCGSPYGEEFRDCYEAGPGLVLVGCDAEGLELRCLGHYMARYDGGAYAEAVINGRKEDGTDVHTINQRAVRLNSRDSAKTFIYALIYGAGHFKLGTTVYEDFTDEVRARFNAKYPANKKKARIQALARLGQSRKESLMENLPALAQLIEAVKQAAKRGYLIGLDGRKLHVRSEHAALNTLLQSAGAVVMKKALVLFDQKVEWYRSAREGVARVVEPVANVHDEFQIETEKEIANDIGTLAANCIAAAGEHFKFRCPLAGSFAVGSSWAHTH
jgi:DNA polymerase-1